MNTQNSITFKIILFFLALNLSFGKNIFEASDFTPATNTTLNLIKNAQVKTTCQSISDCSEGAIECKKDSNGNNSYCIYPEYICSNAENCYILGKTIDKESFVYSNNNIVNCTSNDECISNQCISGQCQVNLNSPNVLCSVDNDKYQCNKLTGESQVNNLTEKKEKKEEENSSSNITLYVVIAIGIIVGAVIFGIVITVCYESAQYMEENPEIQEMRKENAKSGAAIIALL